jgi:hypothetical protein
MYKEMPVIPVNNVVDPKRVIGKMEGRGVADPPPKGPILTVLRGVRKVAR